MKQHKTELLDLRCMDCVDGLRQMDAESVNNQILNPNADFVAVGQKPLFMRLGGDWLL